MSATPLYISPSTVRSLWQEYRVFDDRIEFHTMFGTMTVPFDVIEHAEIAESDVSGLFHGDLHLRDFRPALKLDWANFVEHIVLDKSEGFIRRVLFTPADPMAFKLALDAALARYRTRG